MTQDSTQPYEAGLDKNAANFVPLSPIGFLLRAAAVYPNRTAVIHGEQRYTWRETLERCRRLASALAKRGIGRGDTVAVMAPNVPAIFEAHFGVPMAGAVLNALNIRLDADTIAFILKHGEAKALITDGEFAPVISRALVQLDRKPLVIDIADALGPEGERLGELDYETFLAEGDPDFAELTPADEWDAIALNYTSGTTGNPKGVVYHNRGAYLNALGTNVPHVYGLTGVYGPAVVCAWHDEWDALSDDERARLKARQGVTYPVLDGLMVGDPETLAPVPSDGTTLGEIFFRGNIVMKGYLKNPAATEEAFAGGWFRSGDLAGMHEDGYIEVKDRSKDIIISGGENISTIEVEDVLYRHPAVLEAAVVAKPDPNWGETPCAFVTLKDGAQAEPAEIIAFCRERMARFKAPRQIIFGPLPKTSTGKIQKFVLRERAKQTT